MRKLGMDLGIKSCGFAITDENEIIASSLENFLMPEGDFDAVINRIKQYLLEYSIDGFILGYPLKISGQKSERTLMVEDFVQLLKQHFDIPIILINEQYSTKKAQEIMIAAGLTRQKRKNHKDKLAAQIILDDYLQYYKNKWEKHD
ncbi:MULTISPECIES: Holliday junction resolvase RuvX [unclassified Mycoplasma]|uniref:Holliday junction resolvase RuvX n=1 Tax=unclassified Mycoplasma TaxID=2683645 RepID=UPI00211C97C9|nr:MULTISPECIES: Holliday junction resolvase RuvX [unclassified Mycoplasma]UUM19644.1 Holliday junction resolvase RuvX [Mycoplasma sp. 1578d]UUM24613.1 Holliday junction resolvase RuvX [Mycoplasma sp. 3686d]